MKSILKLFLFMSIILISKYTKENEIATANAIMKANNVEASFMNYKQHAEVNDEQGKFRKKAAEIIYKKTGGL